MEPKTNNHVPPGFRLRNTLHGHNGVIYEIAWSPDGEMLLSACEDQTVRLWSFRTGLLATFRSGPNCVRSVAWSPDNKTITTGSQEETVRVWDAASGNLIENLSGHEWGVPSLNWSPDGQTLATACCDGNVRLWNKAERPGLSSRWRLQWKLRAHNRGVLKVVWSPDGQLLASASEDGAVKLWDAATGELLQVLEGHNGWVGSLAWSPGAEYLASGSTDKAINVWKSKGFLKGVLEAHTDAVKCLDFSFDGRFLASKSGDGTVRLWRCDSWETVAILDEPSCPWRTALAFHPKLPLLATLGDADRSIRIWELDFDVLLKLQPDTVLHVDDVNHQVEQVNTVRYTNAKVVLVGDSGVGKTSLGSRLARKAWQPAQESTHGMNVWTLQTAPDREVMLWDFAGQPEYRLVHQLFLNETTIAVMLFDPTKSDDSFFGIEYWEHALSNAIKGVHHKVLVAARVDVGDVQMTSSKLESYCQSHGYRGFYRTSARTGEGCDDLRSAILNAIPWDELPRITSSRMFKRIKDFLNRVKQGNRIMVRESDLLQEFGGLSQNETPSEQEFKTVVSHVENTGLIKRLSFGDFVLLRPEILNGIASDIIDAARRHEHGLGCVRQADALEGKIRLRDEVMLSRSDKVFLLHATVELFLQLGLALVQDGNLVFPSKFNQQMPAITEDPIEEVEFWFTGPVDNLYTTLVVRLFHGGLFRLQKLWKNAAEFWNARHQICGFQLHNQGNGEAALRVFYGSEVSDDDKALFLKIIADHFADKRIAVRRQRIYRCSNANCRAVVRDRKAVAAARERNRVTIPCQYCEHPIQLKDALETLYGDDEKFAEQIKAMDVEATQNLSRNTGLVSAAAEMRSKRLEEWAGGPKATLALVLTDVVGSTELGNELGDSRMYEVRHAHFQQGRQLQQKYDGREIKAMGDSLMVAFKTPTDALDFALDFYDRTGHDRIKIRAGSHVGPILIVNDDAFGLMVNFTARVLAMAKEAEIWVSNEAKAEIERRGCSRGLNWSKHPDCALKGFSGTFTLWSVETDTRNLQQRP